MNHIIDILADRGRHSRAPENSNFPSDIAIVDPWEGLIAMAERKGFSVTDNGNYVTFYRDSDGSWAKPTRNQGGAQETLKFLERA